MESTARLDFFFSFHKQLKLAKNLQFQGKGGRGANTELFPFQVNLMKMFGQKE